MKSISLILLILAVTSCAPPEKKLVASERLVAGKTIQTAIVNAPRFVLMTGGTAGSWGMLGPLGLFAAQSSAESNGDAIISQNGIQPPSIAIAVELTKNLQTNYGVTLANYQILQLKTANEEELMSLQKTADYSLIIDMNWGTIHNLAGSLAVMNTIHMQLREGVTGKLLVESTCMQKTPHDYGLDELRENNAQKLKSAIRDAEIICSRQLASALGI